MFYVIINAYYSFKVDGDDLPQFWILSCDFKCKSLFIWFFILLYFYLFSWKITFHKLPKLLWPSQSIHVTDQLDLPKFDPLLFNELKALETVETKLFFLNDRCVTVYIFFSPFTIKLCNHILTFISLLMWTLTFECIIVFHIYVWFVFWGYTLQAMLIYNPETPRFLQIMYCMLVL